MGAWRRPVVGCYRHCCIRMAQPPYNTTSRFTSVKFTSVLSLLGRRARETAQETSIVVRTFMAGAQHTRMQRIFRRTSKRVCFDCSLADSLIVFAKARSFDTFIGSQPASSDPSQKRAAASEAKQKI